MEYAILFFYTFPSEVKQMRYLYIYFYFFFCKND